MSTTFAQSVNDFATTLASPHTSGSGTLVLALSPGTLASGRVWRVTALLNPDTDTESVLGIFEATSNSGAMLSGVTAAEGYSDSTLSSGTAIQIRMTAKDLGEVQNAVNMAETTIAVLQTAIAAAQAVLTTLGTAATHAAGDFDAAGAAAAVAAGLGTAASHASTDFISANATQPAHAMLAGPTSGSAAAATFRSLVASDIPDISATYKTVAALGSWAGSTNLVMLGTVAAGTWHATAIVDAYIASAATWNAKQPAGSYLTALTGDVTASGPGSAAATVAAIQGHDVATTVPTDGYVLTWVASTSKWTPVAASGGGSPGGSSGDIQFNSSGSFGGSAALHWDGLRIIVLNGSGPFATLLAGTTLSIFQFNIGAYFGIQAATSPSDAGASHYTQIAYGASRNTAFGDMPFSQPDPGAQVSILNSFAAQPAQIVAGAASQTSPLTVWMNSSLSTLSSIRSDGSWAPPHLPDSAAAADSLYYSTTQSKLVYKDAGGTANPLY